MHPRPSIALTLATIASVMNGIADTIGKNTSIDAGTTNIAATIGGTRTIETSCACSYLALQ